MHSRQIAECALTHASDHARDPGAFAYRSDLDGVVYPAAFHELDVHHIDSTHGRQPRSIMYRVTALIGRDQDLRTVLYFTESFEIKIFDRLLYEVYTQLGKSAAYDHSILDRPSLIGVDPDLYITANSLADRSYPFRVSRNVFTQLDLYDLEAFVDP